ncbi:hypothetical protein ERJ75_000237000 [Trypanosoma vivax]|nr:hypothetical protein ERJ75_000236400 [Trypanosoma vivax]KAH8618667.1 hypothetical protein ERJ75_000237000 [Trypanosoma vivax]
MLRAVARALAQDTAVVSLRCAAPWLIKIRAWIGNVRTSGPRRGVEKWSPVATQGVRQCGAALGESNCLSKKYGFIGAPFDRDSSAVFLGRKTIRKLKETPPLERLAVVELEWLTSPMVYATGGRGGVMFERGFFVKEVGRRLSKLSGGLLQPKGASGLPARAVRQGKRWLSSMLGNKPFTPRRHRPTSATLAQVLPCADGARFCLRIAGRCGLRAARGAERFALSCRARRAPCHWRSVLLLKRRKKICAFAFALAMQRQ